MRPLFTEFLPHFRDVTPSLTFLFSWLMDLSLPFPIFIPTRPCFFSFSREWFEKSAANSRNSSVNGAEIVERAKSIIAGILAARGNRYLIIGRGAFTNYCGNRFVSRSTGLTAIRYTRSTRKLLKPIPYIFFLILFKKFCTRCKFYLLQNFFFFLTSN